MDKSGFSHEIEKKRRTSDELILGITACRAQTVAELELFDLTSATAAPTPYGKGFDAANTCLRVTSRIHITAANRSLPGPPPRHLVRRTEEVRSPVTAGNERRGSRNNWDRHSPNSSCGSRSAGQNHQCCATNHRVKRVASRHQGSQDL